MAAWLNTCRFNPVAGGTGNWVYSSPVTGYQSPVLANAVNTRVYKFRAESADLSQWEETEGAYDSATGTFARTTVLCNSSGTGTSPGQTGAGTKINFTTVPQVAVVALKEDLLSVEESNSFTTAQKTQARTNIDAVGGLFQVAGPASAAKTYTFPNVSESVATLGQSQTFTGVNAFNNNVRVNSSAAVSVEALTVKFAQASQYGMLLDETSGGTSAAYLQFSRLGGTLIGSVTQNAGATGVLFNTTSDERLKDDLRPIANVRETIDGLKVYDFRWKVTHAEGSAARGTGFMAQEAYTFLPEAVSVGGDDPSKNPWSVDYSKMVPTLWAHAQDVNARILALEKRISELEKK